ncbi:MAG TPA: hypothetical protein VMB27_08500 [Solirubrobacteraceae bacterium]|nr:hypothetical protein [Solirubrobacteraceae bacterium]
MTTTTISSKLHRDDRPENGRSVAGSAALRMRVAMKRDALTRELAAGAPPELSPELGLRAAQLVSPRARRQVARTWRGTVKEAHLPPLTRAYFSIIRRGAVINAEDAIDALIARLNSGRPVAAQGMASLHRLMTDGMESPLYTPAEPDKLRRQIALATEALEPEQPEQLLIAA